MAQQPKAALDSGQFSPDTLEFVRLLDQHNVRYVVTGGQAVIYHGYPRFTGDVDFFFSDSPENAKAMFAALLQFWNGSIPGIHNFEELIETGMVIQFGRPPNRIDLLNRIDGVDFEDAWNDKLVLTLSGTGWKAPLYMINLERLLQNKRAAARPKDLDDLRALGDPAAGRRSPDRGTRRKKKTLL